MEQKQGINNTEVSTHPKHAIHRTLAHSYVFYFVFFLLGVVLDIIFKIQIFETSIMLPIGFAMIIFATIIIFWAQLSSLSLFGKEVTNEHFHKGPYHYIQHPTHWGLFFMMLGFGFMVNGLFIIITTAVSHFLAKLTLIRKYESIMLQHFGATYEEYKKSMKI